MHVEFRSMRWLLLWQKISGTSTSITVISVSYHTTNAFLLRQSAIVLEFPFTDYFWSSLLCTWYKFLLCKETVISISLANYIDSIYQYWALWWVLEKQYWECRSFLPCGTHSISLLDRFQITPNKLRVMRIKRWADLVKNAMEELMNTMFRQLLALNNNIHCWKYF